MNPQHFDNKGVDREPMSHLEIFDIDGHLAIRRTAYPVIQTGAMYVHIQENFIVFLDLDDIALGEDGLDL